MRELNEWFLQNRRDFPWRQDPTPYKVWISEVMLQQTRAAVVVPYFERWMALFPDVSALAGASLERVIKAWEGLGYYSRARNLHQGARQIMERFGGEIPSHRSDLESIQGLGPYTVGAILSFGFKQRAVAVDGNVTRVLSRLFCLEENVDRQKGKRQIAKKCEELLDRERPWITAEALIELGATLCVREPRCDECPLKHRCLGHAQNKAASLPIKNSDRKTTELWRNVAVIEAMGKILVKKGEAGRVMADLYEFPYFERGQEVAQAVQQHLGLVVEVVERLPEVTHTFTRYKAHLFPYRMRAKAVKEIAGYQWISSDILAELPFSSGHRRILRL